MKNVLTALTVMTLLVACAPSVPDTAALQGLLVKNNADAAAFAQAVDTATDAKTLATAITAFVTASQSFPAAYKAEMDKHPEFASLSESSMPAELKQALADQAKAKEAVSAAVAKLNTSPLLADPAVTEAYKALADAAGAK